MVGLIYFVICLQNGEIAYSLPGGAGGEGLGGAGEPGGAGGEGLGGAVERLLENAGAEELERLLENAGAIAGADGAMLENAGAIAGADGAMLENAGAIAEAGEERRELRDWAININGNVVRDWVELLSQIQTKQVLEQQGYLSGEVLGEEVQKLEQLELERIDRIEIAVANAVANVDKLEQEGGRELLLKYKEKLESLEG